MLLIVAFAGIHAFIETPQAQAGVERLRVCVCVCVCACVRVCVCSSVQTNRGEMLGACMYSFVLALYASLHRVLDLRAVAIRSVLSIRMGKMDLSLKSLDDGCAFSRLCVCVCVCVHVHLQMCANTDSPNVTVKRIHFEAHSCVCVCCWCDALDHDAF